MDKKTKALEMAAFHTWLTLGEILNGRRMQRGELLAHYEALTEALTAFNKPPRSKPKRRASPAS